MYKTHLEPLTKEQEVQLKMKLKYSIQAKMITPTESHAIYRKEQQKRDKEKTTILETMVSEMRQASVAAHEANKVVEQPKTNNGKQEIEDDELQKIITTDGMWYCSNSNQNVIKANNKNNKNDYQDKVQLNEVFGNWNH